MPKSERARYLQHKRIQTLVEQRMHEFESCFIIQEQMHVGMSQSMIRTKLTFHELYNALQKLDMNMTGLSAEELSFMFGTFNTNIQNVQNTNRMMRQSSSVGALLSHNNNQSIQFNQPERSIHLERIGFSELIKASDRYFSLLGSTNEEIENKKQYTKLHDLYGRRLGRRKVGHGPAAAGHLSQPGFLAHDDGRLGIASPDSMDRQQRQYSQEMSNNATYNNNNNNNNNQISYKPSPSQTQQHSWQDPAVIAGLATKKFNAHGVTFLPMEETGCMPTYDQAFDDPDRYLWEQRWLDKSLGEERKKKLAKKALLGNSHDLATRQNHNMKERLMFKPSGYQSPTQREHGALGGTSARPWATGLNWSQ